MRQGIEKKREAKSPKAEVTVMFHDRMHVLSGGNSFFARGNAASSLPSALAVIPCGVSDASLQPKVLQLSYQTPSPDRTRSRSMPSAEKFSAEEPMACSALAVLMANPNTLGAKAAENPIKKLIERRCCAATY